VPQDGTDGGDQLIAGLPWHRGRQGGLYSALVGLMGTADLCD
jgi:hypothetical protein